MVFYFKSCPNNSKQEYNLYSGEDKFENDELIKYSWPNDVWFHVDNLSSAHVYYRGDGEIDPETLPPELIEDCAQLTKFNSIQGNKTPSVNIIYTLASNLHKTNNMEPGEVNFKNRSKVYKINVSARNNGICRRLSKTKIVGSVDDFKKQHHENLIKIKQDRIRINMEETKKNEILRKEREIEKEKYSYNNLHRTENMTSNKDVEEYDSDDFI
ncbi:Coiled-coil domain-containing protein 25 [Intoshia linei]|uniref:Coiled-coil domain-containing protein 25 n=1 Tax=Intoshia linei TaxID=1819745 RepID=A0A177B6D7_9BILA|nr:Coiled-coil domain-containing protein 25 [Intoshia linei]